MTARRVMNPVDAFMWAHDANGNPVPLEVNSTGELLAAPNTPQDEINDLVLVSMGHQQLSVGTGVASLSVPANTKRALIYVGGVAEEAVRFRADGTDPTGDIGTVILVGDYLDLTDPRINYGTFLANLEFIRRTANTTNITLDIEYFN